ncbi:SixA phosphatase family protein [Flavobacterium psychrotolerans]|uniref:Histidine phosphatase family protein n=1 Tax=Flavobacterium psychrotolerans TaxID=2169410 RepID=A0A2U1JL82_9FLAO|nr:histidine phosphatase family protein [Flavobacterium psychrotolerans]PWA05927.1 histidine phosphatase family protein [Flavobacterium psychrotolerans]
MKNLIIIRHAKSSWDVPLQDIDRPLNIRGVTDAHLVASKCIPYLPKTFLMWSSTAKRASETAIIFAQNISYPIENITFREDLYTFDEKKLEKIIKSCNNDYDNVILFGHNEAITNFVNKFGDVFIENIPTSGFVSMQFHSENWQSIGKGKINKIIFPKDLK